jgi:hypothetical protein
MIGSLLLDTTNQAQDTIAVPDSDTNNWEIGAEEEEHAAYEEGTEEHLEECTRV